MIIFQMKSKIEEFAALKIVINKMKIILQVKKCCKNEDIQNTFCVHKLFAKRNFAKLTKILKHRKMGELQR